MSLVVAVESQSDWPDGDAVVLGGDSGIFDDCDSKDRVSGKCFIYKGIGFGVCGTYRAAQVIRYHWRPIDLPSSSHDVEGWAVTHLVPSLRDLGERHGMEDDWCNAVVGVRGVALRITDDWAVVRSPHGYVCLGSGMSWAEGALAATEGKPAFERVALAVQSALRHCTNVEGPPGIWRVPAG